MRSTKSSPIVIRSVRRAGIVTLAMVAGAAAISAPVQASPIVAVRPAAVAPELTAAKTVAFTGHYKGHATLLINNGAVTIPSVAGTGTGTGLGASKISGKGSAGASAQCDPFSGTGAITGAHAKLTLVVKSSSATGCSSGESGPVSVSFHGVAVVKSGTGALAGASGSLKFHGTLNIGGTSGSQNGPYTVTLTGKLSVKG
ncbi:MAG TPA: hypothetical protein VFN61_07015 [Acidimicrobiales bacterium]|nr:hypothetical protein [Acidimicrobiales bacterium]